MRKAMRNERDFLFIEPIRRLFFTSVLQFQKLMETGSLYLVPFHSSFLNLLFWATHMSPVTTCP